MTGEELFDEIGRIDTSFFVEAEQYRKARQRDKCWKQLVPVAASVCLPVILTAMEHLL